MKWTFSTLNPIYNIFFGYNTTTLYVTVLGFRITYLVSCYSTTLR